MNATAANDQGLLEPADAPPQAAPGPAPVPVIIAAPPPEEPEREIARIRLAMFRRYPFRCLAYVLFAAGLVGLSAWAYAESHAAAGVMLLGLGLFVAARFAYWWLRMQRTLLLVTTRKVVLEGGVFSREASEFPLKEITDVQVEQGAFLSMLDVGDLVIVSGAARQAVVMAVPHPAAVACQIRACKG